MENSEISTKNRYRLHIIEVNELRRSADYPLNWDTFEKQKGVLWTKNFFVFRHFIDTYVIIVIVRKSHIRFKQKRENGIVQTVDN